MLVEATAAKDPARFHRKGKNRPYRDTRINPCVAMGVSQSPLADNLEVILHNLRLEGLSI